MQILIIILQDWVRGKTVPCVNIRSQCDQQFLTYEADVKKCLKFF